jgi:hypothetical protein
VDSDDVEASGNAGLTRAGKVIVGVFISLVVSIGWFTAVMQTNSGTALEWLGWFPPLLCLVLVACWRLRAGRNLMAIGVVAGAVGVAPVLFFLAWFFNAFSHWEF